MFRRGESDENGHASPARCELSIELILVHAHRFFQHTLYLKLPVRTPSFWCVPARMSLKNSLPKVFAACPERLFILFVFAWLATPAESFSTQAAARPLSAMVGSGVLLSGIDGFVRQLAGQVQVVGMAIVCAQITLSCFLLMESWTVGTLSGMAVLGAVAMFSEGGSGSGLKGKVVWITGASSGIGEAMALRYHTAGALVILSARRASELARVKAACLQQAGDSLLEPIILPLDLSQPSEMAEKAAQARVLVGGRNIDILINNGGVSSRSLAEDMPWEIDQQIMTVNYFGPVALTKAVLPGMLASRSGKIVGVSSVQGLVGLPGRTAYSASKHAMHGFFDGLRAEVSSRGVGVTLICPGYVRTALSLNAVTGGGEKHGEMDETTEKGMEPDVLVKRAMLAIERGESQVVIAKDASAHAAQYVRTLMPSLLEWLMKKRARKLLP